MTSKTKYIVIVLLLVVLASTSVGLSTWNIHYQANVGKIEYYLPTSDPSTVESLLNDYIYFETTTDIVGNMVNPKKQDYPIGIDKNDNIFTYTYDGESHTPAVFVPYKDAENAESSKQKGEGDYPIELFLNENVIDTGWGLGETGGIFSEITFKREYRLVALPYTSEQHKGSSDNYCEISAISYTESGIDIYLTWKNGNNGNHKGTNVLVQLTNTDGVYDYQVVANEETEQQTNLTKNKVSVAIDGSLATVTVNGFSPYQFDMSADGGWTETAPSDAGVYQCRFTATAEETDTTATETDSEQEIARKNAVKEVMEILNSKTDDVDVSIDYAAQVTYAITPYQTEMTSLDENSFTYGEKASTVKAAPRANLTSGTMPLAAESTETETQNEQGQIEINGNANSFYVTYGGASYEIQIFSTFTNLDGQSCNVDFSTELLNIAKNLKDVASITSEDHYYTTYGFSSDRNYQITNPVIHYTILRREIKIDSWSSFSDENPTSTVYNGKAQTPTASCAKTYGAELEYSWTNGTDTFTSAQRDVAAYTVSVFIGGEGASNYFLSCADGAGTEVTDTSGEVTKINWTYEITPKEVGITWDPTTLEFTYNGKTQTPTATVTEGELCSDENGVLDVCTVNVTGGKANAGTYTATAESLDGEDASNYKLPDTKPTTDFVINPKQVGVTWDESTLEFTYNGKTQTPTATVTEGELCSDENGVMDVCTVNVTGGKANAGTYTATAENLDGEDASNYKLPDTKPTTNFVINPKQVGVTWGNTSFTYNGTEQAPSATVTDGDLCTNDDGVLDVCTVKVDGSKINAGTGYTATADSLDNSNYKLPDTKPTTTFDIEQKEVTLTWGDTQFTYDGNEHAPTVTVGGLCTVDGVTDVCTVTITGGQVNASATAYTATASELSNPNYKLPADATTSFTIAPKSVTLTWSGDSFTYDKTEKCPSATINADDLCSSDTCTVTVSGGQTDAGSYTATATLSNGNYAASNSTSKFTITPKEIALSWSDLSFTYDGTSKTPTATVSGLVDGDTCTVTTITGAQTDAGTHTATATALSNGNYTLPADASTSFTIAKATVTISWSNTSLTYNGKEQAPTATAGGLFGGDKVTVTVTGGQTDAGSYTATATGLGGADAGNYELPTNGLTTTFTIAKASIDKPAANTTSFVYTGEEQTYALTENAAYTISNNKRTNAGSQTVTVALTNTNNYQWADGTTADLEFTFTIAKITVGISWGNTSLTYNGADQAPTATVTGLVSGDDVTVTVDGTATDASETPYTATVTGLLGADAGNYELPTNGLTTTFTIAKASIDKPAANTTSFVYTGEEQTYALTENAAYTISNNKRTNAGSQTVTVALTNTNNYQWADGTTADLEFTFTIAKASNRVTLTTNGWTYGDKPTDESAVVTATAAFGSASVTYYSDGAHTTEIDFANIVNAGTYYVVATSTESDNYSASSAEGSFVVSQRVLTVTGTSISTKDYDSNATVVISDNGTLQNIASGDNLDGWTITGQYCVLQDGQYVASASAGSGKTIVFTVTLPDTEIAKNYTCGELVWKDKYSINKKTITLASSSVISVVHDANYRTFGNLFTNADASKIVFEGLVGEDALTLGVDYTVEKMTSGVYSYDSTSTGNVVGSTYKAVINLDTTNYKMTSTYDVNYCYVKYKTALIGSTYYTVEDAIAQANSTATSSATVQITFAGDYSSATSYVVTAFTKLTDSTNLPNCTGTFTLNYIEFVVPHSSTLSWGNDKWVDVSTPTASSGNVYAALHIPQGIGLTFNSSSVLAVTAALGYTNNWTKACKRGVLVNDGTIIIKSSSSIYSYGYIKSSLTKDENDSIIVDADNAPVTTGRITAENGSTVVEAMTLFDYPGGNSVSKIMGKAFPSNAWVAHNISCQLQINAGATYQGYVMVVANDTVQSAFATILGANNSVENCLFKPAEASPDQNTNYVIKNTRPARAWAQSNINYLALYTISGSNSIVGQRDTLEIYGSYTDDVLTVTVSGQSLQTSTTISAPIGYMDIVIKNGANLSLTSSDYAILPGSKLVIEENANVTIGSGIDVALIDLATMEGWLSVTDSNKSFNLYCVDKTSAYAVVNGTLTVNGNIGGEIQTIGSTATLNLTSATSLSASYNTMTGSYGASQDFFGSNTYYCNGKSKALFGEIITDTFGTSHNSGSFETAQYKSYNSAWYKTGISNTISYVLNDGSGSITTDSVYNGNSTTLPTPTRTGYSFVGWQDSEGNVYSGGTSLTLFANITLTAQWSIDSYTITVVDENGNEINSVTREYGSKYGDALPQLTKDGYFLSWNIVGTETYITAADTVAIGNHTVQAVWEEQSAPVEITFKDPEGGNDDIVQTLNGGSKFSSLPTLERTGYSFSGWFTQETGGEQIAVGSIIPETSTTYYAQWSIKSYTITFNTDGGSTISPITQNYGTAITEPTPPTKDGYTFYGWNPSIPSTMPAENMTITAQWTINSYTITFNTDGGSTISPITQNYGTAITEPTPPTKDGYTFNGWNPSIPSTMPAENMTITAQWTENDDSGCLAAGTLITMADGSQKKVEDVTTDDYLLVFNHETGQYEASKVLFIDYDGWQVWRVVYLEFENGTTCRIIYEHGFFDRTLNKYVYIDEFNMSEFVGHEFATAEIDGTTQGIGTTKLIRAYVVEEYTGCYSPTTVYHLNLIADGLLSMPGGIEGMFNFFDYDSETLAYDEQAMQQDIATYGLMTYEDFAEYMSYEVYCCFPAQYIGVSLGKGLMTEEYLQYLIERYVVGMGLEDSITETSTTQPTATDGVEATLPPAVVTGDEDVVEEETTE